MKIRKGFVSNSSSSSFIAIVETINITDITKEMLNKKNIFTFGRDLSEARDIIYLDEMMLKYFQLFPSYDDWGDQDFIFYKLFKSGDDEMTISKDELEDDIEYTMIRQEVDYSGSDDVDILFRRYQNEIEVEDVEKYINQLFREKKLKRILEDED